jgi:putative ABC transport system ATP-binding protein
MLHMQGVSKVYAAGGGVRALDHVTLAVGSNDYLGIVGASGSGKSTMLHLMGLLDTPTEGELWFDDLEIRRLSDTELSRLRGRAIGFVFQAFHLIPHLSVLENVELPLFYQGVPPRERRARALASLEEVRMTHRRRHRPSELSGGECQRTAIARALVTNPRLILADEPTGNLDSAHGAEILATFRRLHEAGRAVVVITHDPAIARSLPRRVRLADGRIVEVEAA